MLSLGKHGDTRKHQREEVSVEEVIDEQLNEGTWIATNYRRSGERAAMFRWFAFWPLRVAASQLLRDTDEEVRLSSPRDARGRRSMAGEAVKIQNYKNIRVAPDQSLVPRLLRTCPCTYK